MRSDVSALAHWLSNPEQTADERLKPSALSLHRQQQTTIAEGTGAMSIAILDKIIKSPRLPTLPSIAVQVLDLTQQPQVDLERVAEVIRNDQALAGKVLRTVNSTYYGLKKPCASIHQAMVYLGLNTVKTLVLGFSLVDSVSAGQGGGGDEPSFDFLDYWRRGLFSAVAAREIATSTAACDPETAFLAALMQDIGMVAMYRVLGQAYCAALASSDHAGLRALERKAFDLDHAEAGAELARHWRLPDVFADAIRHHHDSGKAPGESLLVARAVELAGLAAMLLSLPEPEKELEHFNRSASQWFGLNHAHVTELLNKIGEGARQLAQLFHVAIGPAPNVEAILARAEELSIAHQAELARQANELRHTNAYLNSLALRDPLTGIANRRSFDLQLARNFDQAIATAGCLALIFADADGLKAINDQHGHQVGDLMLARVAQQMRELVGASGEVCRYGGDEFAAIIPGADCATAAKLAERLRQAIQSKPVRVQGRDGMTKTLTLTMSWGVAALERHTRNVLLRPNMLVRLADDAVYAAKAAGGDCVRVFAAPPQNLQAA
jgi:diguanylate cyclase (GGDEF)-like protein